jgi:pimeloyl-ACP methyl ester carboxylesterase
MEVSFATEIGPDQLTMAYESFGITEKPAIILIMGGGAQMISWPIGFCQALVARGFRVIRFDNRDVGLSTHLDHATVPDFPAVMKGDYSTVPYTLSDMAADVVGLMDKLNITTAHIVGMSLGGMIAQTIAIEHPQRVRSLTSLYSTTGNSSVGQTDMTMFASLGMPPSSRQEYVDWWLKAIAVITAGKYPADQDAAREVAGLAWDRGLDWNGMTRQSAAVLKSGDRTAELKSLRVPALIIHGTADRMINVSGGIATAQAIPGARLKLIEGLGHGIPQPLWDEFADAIHELASTNTPPMA